MGGVYCETFPGFGLAFSEPKPIGVVNRTGGTRVLGEIGMFDIRLTVATHWKVGAVGSALTTLVTPTAAEDGWSILAVFLESVANGSEGKAIIWDPFARVLYQAGQDPVGSGVPLGYNDLQFRLDGTFPNAAGKCVGVAIESTATRAAGSLMSANFNGLFGWGKP